MALDSCINARDIVLEIFKEKPVDEPAFPPKCCICEVPEHVRKENEDAYTPRLISIGPIHRDNKKLNQMAKQKLMYFQKFCQRLSDEMQRDLLEEYTTWVGDESSRIRSCYSENLQLEENEFVPMILLDAVFIMELFLRNREGPPAGDKLFQNSYIQKSIERDLLLIENQIPFFVLERLYGLVPAAKERRHSSFLELAYYYYKKYDPYPGEYDPYCGDKVSLNETTKNMKLKEGWKSPEHFTDLIRYLFVPLELCNDNKPAPIIKTATKLKGRGVTFAPISEGCLLDVKFKNKIPVLNWLSCFLNYIRHVNAQLRIPKLIVDNSTESLLRNLMAFEQCYYPDHQCICSYVALLDYLIDTRQDVDVLVESKVIVHELGSDKDLVVLVNALRKRGVVNSNHYGSLARNLDRHYRSWRNKTLAPLGSVYFPNLWRGTGTILGLLILALAILNFYKTVKDLS